MSISRWDPWSDFVSLRDAMNSLLEESFVRPRGGAGGQAPFGLALDVRETADAFIVEASTPGVKPEDVQISLLGDVLTIRGQREESREERGDGDRWLMRERQVGAFQRSIRLPGTVSGDACDARFDHGVLTITLPKAEEAKERQIAVRAGGGADQPATRIESGKATAAAD